MHKRMKTSEKFARKPMEAASEGCDPVGHCGGAPPTYPFP